MTVYFNQSQSVVKKQKKKKIARKKERKKERKTPDYLSRVQSEILTIV